MSAAATTEVSERVCKTCMTSKSVADFHRWMGGVLSWRCEFCHKEIESKRQKALWASDPVYREQHNASGKAARRGIRTETVPAAVRGDQSVCKVCAVVKPMVDFVLRGGRRLHTCAACYKEAENLKARIAYRESDVYYVTKRASGRRAQFKSRYGITPEIADGALAAQFGLCANRCCAKPISFDALKASGSRAVVDHCHVTMAFRAILCDGCNLLLGRMEKSENIFLGLVEYIEKHRAD